MKIVLLIFVILNAAGLLAGQTPTPKPMATPSSVRVVRAQAGDTVTRIAERYDADPVEVAKFNGLLPNSVLGAGREIRLPRKGIYIAPLTKLESSPCFSDQKIELTTTALPANFYGYDIKKIVEALEARKNLVKDEFETTPQFLERCENEGNKPLLGNIDLNATLFFEVDGSFSYDADREVMHTSYDIPYWDKMNSPICGDLVAKYKNAGVNVNFAEKPSTTIDEKNWSYSFPVQVSEARRLKPDLRLLLVATLGKHADSVQNYKSDFHQYGSYKALGLKLSGFWIYNVKTGAVISKQDVKFGDLLPPKAKHADSIAQAKKLYSQGKDDEVLALVRRVLPDSATRILK